jgi:hypothetical protein
MSNQDKHITHWSPSDIQKYLKGELSSREMHQLEKAALDDPFLADAIEGLSQRPAAPLAKDLGELRSRINTGVGKKRKPFIWMKMAAALLLLIGLGYTAWYILLDSHQSKLAEFAIQHTPPPAAAAAAPRSAERSQAAAQPQTAVPAQPTNATGADTAVIDPLAAASKSVATARSIKPKSPQTKLRANAGSLWVPADTLALLNTRIASLDFRPASANRLVFDSVDTQKRMPGALGFRDQSAKQLEKITGDNKAFRPNFLEQNRVYSGQVLDFNNRPLAGASLLVSGPSNAVTTTNALGQFKLNLRPQDTTQRLTVAMIGYENASLAVNKLNSDQLMGNTIILREQPAALNEVVVSGLDRRARETIAEAPFDDKSEKLDSFWIKVAPVTGRLAYLDYLQASKKGLGVDTTIQGDEDISFAVDPKGVPTDFKIEHSLSPAHDAAVIRLIAEGAHWKTNRGKNIRALVRVSFP